jgi:hypothetical protein
LWKDGKGSGTVEPVETCAVNGDVEFLGVVDFAWDECLSCSHCRSSSCEADHS